MGWFSKQIHNRIQNDDEALAEAFARMANVISDEPISVAALSQQKMAQRAVADILRFYHVKSREIPGSVKKLDDILEYVLRPNGIMHRTVRLKGEWYKKAAGAMLAYRQDGTAVALLPNGRAGYQYTEYDTGAVITIDASNVTDISSEAVCFYKPFPLKQMDMRELLIYMSQTLQQRDYSMLIGLSLLIAVVGMVSPAISRYLYSDVLTYRRTELLIGSILSLLCVTVAGQLFTTVKELWCANMQMRIKLSVESAMMMRLLSLPVDFFKKYSSGELYSRVKLVGEICDMLFNALLTTGLAALCSMIYIAQIFAFSADLVMPALLVTLMSVSCSVLSSCLRIRVSRRRLEAEGRESGFLYSVITGIEKIKNAGAEKRVFAKWTEKYVPILQYICRPGLFLQIHAALNTSITLFGTVILYYYAMQAGVSVADYMAFTCAYAYVNVAFAELANIAVTIAGIKPGMEMVMPIITTEPEVSWEKQVLTRLSGSIELSHVSFRYDETTPDILHDLSLKIRSGQYIAIVGSTGCGKSTLMRVLLGFERPQKGAVYYDGKDMSTVDLKSLRQKIGVVLQDGKMFQGDIYSNITISMSEPSLERAWEAAELAGIADDIRSMPMGMSTIISEGQGGISAGQRQRILIARAIAGKPKILFFDEATSALDNITQKIVSDSLASMNCTRIVIAHRLSTIRECDRIVMLHQGQIVEDGTYEELIAKGGHFAKLVEQQL